MVSLMQTRLLRKQPWFGAALGYPCSRHCAAPGSALLLLIRGGRGGPCAGGALQELQRALPCSLVCFLATKALLFVMAHQLNWESQAEQCHPQSPRQSPISVN